MTDETAQDSPDQHASRDQQDSHRSRWIAAVGPLIGLILLAAVGFVLHRELGGHRLREVFAEMRAIPLNVELAAIALAATSYWLLGFYDILALRYIGRSIPYARTMFTAFISYSFGHTIGIATLTGGAIRYRMYAVAGLSATDVATVAGFCTVTSSIGLTSLIAAALLLEPGRLATVLHLSVPVVFAAGIIAVGLLAAYSWWGVTRREPVQVWGWSLQPPGARIILPQLALGIVDIGLAAAVLWVLLPSSAGVGLAAFAGIYAIATSAGLISHVPGGLGVFESVMLISLPQVPPEQLLGALIAYRAIYYLLPLLLASLLFGFRELAAQGGRLFRVESSAAALIAPVVPQVAGSLVLISGLVLLVSGATASLDADLSALRAFVPLPILELSHLAGSVAGLGLVVLARALFRRASAAYHLVMWLLWAGALASLLRGLALEQAALLGVVIAVVWLGRRSFYRSSPAISERFSPVWVATVIAVVGVCAWVGFISYRQVPYSHDLWWTFAFDADAPRMLRALLVVSILATAFLLTNLLGRPRFVEETATREELALARRIISQSPSSLANAALIGDKRLHFNDAKDAFLMYQISGRSWVALGDPVGPPAAQEELAWDFRELTDREGAWTVFYQASAQKLPMYVDLGLTALKIGEEARIALADFSLGGSERAELRQARRRAERDGASFAVLDPPVAGSVLTELRRVSDEWLEEKSTGEKGFSIGRFSESYVSQFPLAVVFAEGRPAAFANIWRSGTAAEVSVDLMRFSRDAPRSAMDYLFVELMLWGKQQGFDWFSLGMSPLAGLSQHPLAPAWNRVGHFIFRHGEHFYNFEGLRHYKAKFLPVWSPRYLVAPGGLALPRVLADISMMIAGGAGSVIRKSQAG